MITLTRISLEEIQSWLSNSKLKVELTDPAQLDQLELFHWNIVSGRLAQRFTVTSWLNAATTPSLVRQIVSMGVAASIYRRSYSEDLVSVTNSWADWLDKQADCLVKDLVAGNIQLPTEPGIEIAQNGLTEVAFYPTDTSSAADGEPKFTMGSIF